MELDYKTLSISLALMFAGSMMGPFFIIFLAILVLTYKNHEVLLNKSPPTKKFVDELKDKIKPYVAILVKMSSHIPVFKS